MFAPFELEAGESINFNRDIRPILSENCFFCHGPDANERKADLRLDDRKAAISAGAFVPGDPGKSELFFRVYHEDGDEIMPPPESKVSLTEVQKKLLGQWIEEGAVYEEIWSFVPPRKADLPELSKALEKWPRNGIDHFVAKKLADERLVPSPEASREMLIRRVALDLTGLPPTPEQVKAFLSDQSEKAYEKVVDQFLASPHYGERMALPWLDAARYADTGGYQGDLKKTQWPWRDWVIHAYNDGLPFDQFTLQQLAGDLLPDPTEEQRLATAFNRNHRINDEGGIIPEEFLVEYVADRVETTSTVWMGLTVGCARCHDHKYDPITQRDFYELYAFFNSVPEKGKDGDLAPAPNMKVYTGGTRAEHEQATQKVAGLKEKQAGYAKVHQKAFADWVKAYGGEAQSKAEFEPLPAPLFHLPLDKFNKTQTLNLGSHGKPAVSRGIKSRLQTNKDAKYGKGVFVAQGAFLDLGKPKGGYRSDQPMSWSAWVNTTTGVSGIEGPVFSCVTPDKHRRGYHVNLREKESKKFQVVFRIHSDRFAGESIDVISSETITGGEFSQIGVTYDGSGKAAGVRIYINGQAADVSISKDNLKGTVASKEETLLGCETENSSLNSIRDEMLANTFVDDARIYREALTAKQVNALFEISPDQILAANPNRSKPENTFLSRSYFRNHDEEYQKLSKELTTAEAVLKGFETNKITTVSVMEEMPEPRETFVLDRGAYDQPRKEEKLSPATIASLPPMDPELPRNRLGLAQWLLSPEHPLTSRVVVNRYWQLFFGIGLVKTPEDFGSQGSLPSHPELLDWLAIEFRESGWDVKEMHKRIVMSATYRQSSVVDSTLQQRDPENRLLARGARFRLNGQALRDQVLSVSGQLNSKIGGPPVMPYQPAGLWEEVSAKGVKYIEAKNEDLYRRSLYTFWRRTVPPPSMMNFDNSSREICSVTSTRTNTPLQAMNLLNDPQYVEAARLMATRMIKEGGKTVGERIAFGHSLVLARKPHDRVLQILTDSYGSYLTNYQEKPEAAGSLIKVGNAKPDEEIKPSELAAMTAIASVILNLDETVTKE